MVNFRLIAGLINYSFPASGQNTHLQLDFNLSRKLKFIPFKGAERRSSVLAGERKENDGIRAEGANRHGAMWACSYHTQPLIHRYYHIGFHNTTVEALNADH